MMFRWFAALILVALPVSVAHADECIDDEAALEALEYAFGNTIRISDGSETVDVYFDCDGTFATRSSATGDRFGKWEIINTEICTKIAGAEQSCGSLRTGRSVGEIWEHPVGDRVLTIEILPGR